MPDCIFDDVHKEDSYTTHDNIFHASELAYTCMFKAYMDRTTGKQFPDDAKWNLYRGRIFDSYITKLFDEDQVRVQRRVHGTPYVIRGRIDGLNYDENCIYELKSIVSVKWIKNPLKHHVPQGLFYKMNYDPKAKLKFIYVSMDGCKTFEFKDTKKNLKDAEQIMTDYDNKAKILGDSLINKEPPEPTRANECKWCRYKTEGLCPICKPRKKKVKEENSGFKFNKHEGVKV